MISKLLLCFAFIFPINFYSQSNIVVTGGDASGSNGTSSFSVGQIDYLYAQSSDFSSSQGLQQPFEIIVLDVDQPLTTTNNFVAYPNPVTYDLILKTTKEEGYWNYEIVDINGRILKNSTPISTLSTSVSMKELPAGIYIISIKKDDHSVQQIKILKK